MESFERDRDLSFASTKWYICFARMNKTLYLKDDEAPVWERARELAGDKLSPVIVTALKQFIAMKEAEPRGFERIEVKYEDADDDNLPKRKAFYGRWIFPPSEPLERDEQGETCCYAVAVTAKGNAVFFTGSREEYGYDFDRFTVCGSLEQAAASRRLNYAARKAIDSIGVPIEELDI